MVIALVLAVIAIAIFQQWELVAVLPTLLTGLGWTGVACLAAVAGIAAFMIDREGASAVLGSFSRGASSLAAGLGAAVGGVVSGGIDGLTDGLFNPTGGFPWLLAIGGGLCLYYIFKSDESDAPKTSKPESSQPDLSPHPDPNLNLGAA